MQTMGIVFFNIILILCTLPVYLIAKVSIILAMCKPMRANSYRRKAVLISTCIAWRIALGLSCWIKRDCEGLREFHATLGNNGRPAVIVANHASFMDTILLVALTPLSKISHVKMLIASHLLKIPCLGTIASAMGHLAVPYKQKASEGSFELDKELMAVRQQELQDHVAAGNIAAWFPEGTMNRDNIQDIKTFRAGGFTLTVNVDVQIWCVAEVGQSICWPARSSAGGAPCKIGVRIFKLCESSKGLLAAQTGDFKDPHDAAVFLANLAHEQIQERVNQLVADGYGEKRADTGIAEPLLGNT